MAKFRDVAGAAAGLVWISVVLEQSQAFVGTPVLTARPHKAVVGRRQVRPTLGCGCLV